MNDRSQPEDLQILDVYHGYLQWKNKNNNYQSDIEIQIGHDLKKTANSLDIGWYYMPEGKIDPRKFDLNILDNCQHHFEVCLPFMYEAITNYENCYLTHGSCTENTYPNFEKLIYCPNMWQFQMWYGLPMYPTYFEDIEKDLSQRKNLIYISGQGRPDRYLTQDLLKLACKDFIDFRSNNFSQQDKLPDSWFETDCDTKFREFVNLKYSTHDNGNFPRKNYYTSGINVGINNKFGNLKAGNLILDEYKNYKCVIFSESSWLNDTVQLTEKIVKCFVSKTIPCPIGGANIDLLYNKLGFQTAWNLLPEQLQLYNYEKDHVKRYQMCSDAIAWLARNHEMLTSTKAHDLIENNFKTLYTNKLDKATAIQIDNLIRKYI